MSSFKDLRALSLVASQRNCPLNVRQIGTCVVSLMEKLRLVGVDSGY